MSAQCIRLSGFSFFGIEISIGNPDYPNAAMVRFENATFTTFSTAGRSPGSQKNRQLPAGFS